MRVIYHTTNNKDICLTLGDFYAIVQKAQEINKNRILPQQSQIIVVLTSKGNIYSTIVSDPNESECSLRMDFVNKINDNNDTTIEKIVCIWSDGYFDMPSYSFRKLLCDLNKNNINAEMILSGQHYFVKKKMGQTFAKKIKTTINFKAKTVSAPQNPSFIFK